MFTWGAFNPGFVIPSHDAKPVAAAITVADTAAAVVDYPVVEVDVVVVVVAAAAAAAAAVGSVSDITWMLLMLLLRYDSDAVRLTSIGVIDIADYIARGYIACVTLRQRGWRARLACRRTHPQAIDSSTGAVHIAATGGVAFVTGHRCARAVSQVRSTKTCVPRLDTVQW